MGVKKNSDIKWSESLIQERLYTHFLSPSTKRYEIFGKFVYDWESDYLCITKSGYVYECEIKISRGDYQNDFKNKVAKHIILEAKDTPKLRPNYFYYVVPDGLITKDEVPNGYGLIYVKEWGLDIVKEAKKIHSEKVDFEKLKLIDKFYWGYLDYWNKFRKFDMKSQKDEIRGLNKTIMDYDDMLSESTCEIESLKLDKKTLKDIIEKFAEIIGRMENVPENIQKIIDNHYWEML